MNFVAGYLSETYGQHATAFGLGCRAGNNFIPTTDNNFACGDSSVADGGVAFSTGKLTNASGYSSASFGLTTIAAGNMSIASGETTHAAGTHAFTMGDSTEASGDNALSCGHNSRASGDNALSFGDRSFATGLTSTALGTNVLANGNNSFIAGHGAPWLANNQSNSFMVGYNSDAPTFYVSTSAGSGTSGNVGIGGSGYAGLTTPDPIEKLEVWNGNIVQTNVDLVANTTATSGNSSTNLVGLSPGTCPVFGLTTNNLGTTNTISGVANSFVQVGVDGAVPVVNWDANSLLTFNIDASTTSCTPATVMELGNHPLGYSLVLYGLGWSTVGGWTGSDIRFKNNISDIENPFDVLSKLKGKSYNFRYNEFPKYNFDDKRTFGFIAQELQEVLPEAVRMGPDSFLAVNYMTLIPYLCEGIKIHHEEIEKLKNSSEFQEKNSVPTITDSVKINLEKQVDSMKVLSELQTNKIDSLEQVLIDNMKETQEIKEKLNSLIACLSTKGLCENVETISTLKDEPFLGQNTPNPFANTTVIPYYLPEGVQNAMIEVYNSNSNVVYKFVNLKTGHGSVQINHQGVNGEVLYYRLIIHGEVFKVLKMIRIE
jgi:hypothetical protein